MNSQTKKNDTINRRTTGIASHELQIWYADLTSSQHNIENLHDILDQTEKNRVANFSNKILKRNYIVTRGILRIILSKYLQIPPTEIQLTYNKYGKPKCAYTRELNFNLSHSGNFVIYTFTLDYKVGVDLEFIRHIKNSQKIAKRFFSEEENTELNALPENKYQDAFFHCWTRKEAFIKALGVGLSYPLNQFSVKFAENICKYEIKREKTTNYSKNSIKSSWNFEILNNLAAWTFKTSPSLQAIQLHTEFNYDINPQNWSLLTFHPTSNYIAALAVIGKITKITQCELNLI